MVFHLSLSDSKSPQVSRTRFSIQAVLNNALVWMVSTRPPTSKSSSRFSNPLVTVPNAPIKIWYNCHLHVPLLERFSYRRLLMVFHWSLSNSKSPQFTRTRLSILAYLNNAVVWIVSACPLISMSTLPFINPSVTALRAPITTGIKVTSMFQRFPFPSKVLFYLFAFDSFSHHWGFSDYLL